MSGSPAQYSGWECRYIDISQAPDPMGRDLELLKLELELDKDGSLVSIESRGWNIRVVPGRIKHWRHPFVHQRHKHVFAMRPARTRVCGQFRHDQETIGTDTTYRPGRRAWNRAAGCAADRLCGSAAAVQRRLPVQG